MLIHVLGAPVHHHNLTVLRFFNDVMATERPVAEPRQFMVVAPDASAFSAFNHLAIRFFPDKKALARAVVALAQDHQQRFFFHGQFNPWIWLAILSGQLRCQQVWWHVWGADLYEGSGSLKFRLFYLLRRRAQGKVAHLFATRGDIDYYQQRYPHIPTSLLYFPTRMMSLRPAIEKKDSALTILLGNSGDASNRHLSALQEIHQQFGDDVSIVIPLGYPANNDAYIQCIRQTADRLFHAGQVKLLTERLPFTDYLALITDCDLGYFIFERQQGIGTLCLLIQAGVPFVLSRKNPFWRDLVEQQVPVLFIGDPLNREVIDKVRQQMLLLDHDHIAFFDPAFIQGWQQALTIAAGETS